MIPMVEILGLIWQTGIGFAVTPRVAETRRDPVVSVILASAIEVHRHLGPGLLEGVYQKCLVYELVQQGVEVQREVAVPVLFKGIHMDCGFRLDLVVARTVIVEVKCVDRLLPVHSAQVLTYLRLTGASQALLMNFNGVTLMEGVKSFLGGGK